MRLLRSPCLGGGFFRDCVAAGIQGAAGTSSTPAVYGPAVGVTRFVVICALVAAAAPAVHATPARPTSDCTPARVHYTPYPGGAPGLGRIPWVRATSRGLGLIALLWYWPAEWRTQNVERAVMPPGGKALGGWNTKVMWVFTSAKAKRVFTGGSLIVRGERLDGDGKTWQSFVPIGYEGQNGAPSYASIIALPTEGCWRLRLGAGGLHATVVFEATAAP
jgi:hypothetical protein